MKHLLAAAIVAFPALAFAQGSVLQAGPPTAQHAPMYTPDSGFGQTVVQDSGPAGGGNVGLGLSEMLQVNPSATPASGTGPLGTHDCRYSAPVTSAGYYYLCFDASGSSGGLLAYGNAGNAPALPFQLSVNGVTTTLSALTFPPAGIANSNGANWASSYSTSGSGSVVALATGPAIAGGTLTGTFTGTPTFSGNLAFTGTPTFANPLAIPSGSTIPNPTISGTVLGSPTYSGNPTYSGTVTFSGSVALPANVQINGTITGTPTWSGLNTFSAGATIAGGTLSGTFAGNPTLSGNVAIGGTLGVTGAATLNGGTLTGTFAGNPTLSGNVTLSGAGTSLAVTNSATFGTLGTAGTYQNNVSGASTTTPWLQGFFNVEGTTTYSAAPLYTGFILQQNDGASHPNQNQLFFQILDQTNGSLWSGSRQALSVTEYVRASSSNMPCGAAGCDYFVAATIGTVINANVGGTNVSPFGLGIGISPGCILENTATYWISCHGIETSSGITASASAQELTQIKIYDPSTVRATYESSFLSMTAVNVTPVTGSGLVGSLYGIEFGSLYSGNWPFAADSTMIAALPRTLSPNAGQVPPLANIGVDFTQVNFTTNAWQSPGFYVDAKGQLTHLAGNASITDTSNGIAIDIPNLAVTACNIGGNSGASYVAQTGSPPVFDIVREPVTGTLCKITAVNGSGNVTGITLAQPGYSSVANPTNQAVTGGTGNQALTVNLTTATLNTLTLNPSGGIVSIGAANLGGLTLAPYTIANLPSCVAGIAGDMVYISNGVASPTRGATVSTSGAVGTYVVCNGSNWTY